MQGTAPPAIDIITAKSRVILKNRGNRMTLVKSVVRVSLASALLLMPTAANTGGSISLEEVVTRLTGQSKQLMQELHLELTDNGKPVADVQCGSRRLGRYWTHLGGLRIPIFDCKIGTKHLIIDGDVTFYNPQGKGAAEPDSAKYISLSNQKWSWK